MSGPPVFQRSPRLRPEIPQGEVELPAPPPVPTEPAMSLMMAVWSVIPGLLGALVIHFFSRRSGMGGSYLLLSLPMMAAGCLVQIGHFYLQKRKYHRDVAEREKRYRALLDARRQELTRAREQQRNALRHTDPDPGECVERVLRADARMWERSPHDDDFLALRLGLGKTALGISIKTQRPANSLEIDPLHTEAQHLAGEFSEVAGVPVHLPVREALVSGMVGARQAVLKAVRAMAMQAAVHHSPGELKLVAIFPEEEAGEWAWLRWLPHVWSSDRQRRYLAADKAGARRLLSDLQEQLARRKANAAARPSVAQTQARATPDLPVYLFLIADPRLVQQEAILPLLLREGEAVGAYTLFLAGRREELPMECRAIVEMGTQFASLIRTAPIRSQAEFLPDGAEPAAAEEMARSMAPIRLQQASLSTEIPRKVTLLETLGVTRVEELEVAARWCDCQTPISLAVPIGARAGGERLLFDLHEKAHGPHGLVAGATGSGKSELLQALVAALAVSFHPHEVAFVMVDYKGGGMANAFKGLPHLAGTITNLEGSLARRALTALKSELKRRQRLLGEAGVNHIDDYIRLRRQQSGHLQPLPHLVVVVDEFAELKAEQPEFMRELVSAVRVGRSLGVHLILATQKPAGVVDEQIWSNSRFRLCLRVERPEDSQEVLRCPDAASITGAGRGYFQVGNNERFELFQAGYGGAPYAPDVAAAADPYEVAEVGLDGRRYAVGTARPTSGEAFGETQLQAVVDHVKQVAEAMAIEPVAGPWLPPLSPEIPLQEVRIAGEGWNDGAWAPAVGWIEPAVGRFDDPEEQRQGPLRLPLGRDGHFMLFGAPGTGKTTFLQSLITSLALDHSPADLHLYLVDCSGRSLSLFGRLPHVGAVIAGDEEERMRRLLRFLVQELARRKELLARAGVNTLAAYRQLTGEPLAALVVVLDNYQTFAAAYLDEEELVAQVAREGGNHGIHLVLTANSPSTVRHRVSSNITLAVALQLADRGDYAGAVGRTNGLEPAPHPGRGLIKGTPPLEFQTALPAPGEAEWERSAAIKELCERMDQAWTGPRPRPVRALPEVVPLADLLPLGDMVLPGDLSPAGGAAGPDDLAAALGLDVVSLEPFTVDLDEGPHFLIGGPAAGGKSTLLQTWMLALAERLPPERLALWVADLGEGELAPLRSLPQVRGYVTEGDGLAGVVKELSDLLQGRRQAVEAARKAGGEPPSEMGPALVLVVDDYDTLRSSLPDEAKETLERLVRRERGLGFYSLVAGSSSGFSQYSYESLLRAFKELPAGFVLGSNDHAALDLFSLRPLTGEPGKMLAPGLGYYARRGRARAVKVAIPGAGAVTVADWVGRICRRWVEKDAADRCPAG